MKIVLVLFFYLTLGSFGLYGQTRHLVDESEQKSPFDIETLKKAEGSIVNVSEIKSSGASPHVQFLIDSSGSMGQILEKNKTKMYYLKKLMEAHLTTFWKKEAQFGLQVYGGKKKNDCSDIAQPVKLGRNTLGKITNEIQKAEPVGMTPIHESIKVAFESLKTQKGPKRIVVVTDGEDTCGGDPCKTADELKKTNLDLEFYVVALGFKGDPEALDKVKCIGETMAADSESSLNEALSQIKSKILEKNNLKVISPNQDAPVYLYVLKNGKRQLFRTFYARTEIAVPPGTYEAVVGLNPPYSFGQFVIPPGRKVTLTVAGTGNVLISYFGQNLNVEVLDKNLKAVARFKSDVPAQVPIGQWQIRAFRSPFYEKSVQQFFVYPNGNHKIEINGVGMVKVEDKQLRGLYVYDQEQNLVGQHLTNQPMVLKSSVYSIHVDDNCTFDQVVVRDKKEITVLSCSGLNRK